MNEVAGAPAPLVRLPTTGALRRLGIYSVVINVCLVASKFTMAAVTGSLALRADAVHSTVDVLASVAVLVGLAISNRKSKSFPYGMYKVENLVAMGIAILLFVVAAEIGREVFAGAGEPVFLTPWLVAITALFALVPLGYSLYEMRVARKSGSPSLMADARHFQADVISAGAVFLALLGQSFGLPLDRIGAGVVVIFIVWAAVGLLLDSARVLLDASLDKGVLGQIRMIVDAEPAVSTVKSITGRNSGRFRFVEVEVTVRTVRLEKAHEVSERIERAVKAGIPRVDRVVVHYEPEAKTENLYAIPLAADGETVNDHFGHAPRFVLIRVNAADGRVLGQETIANVDAGIGHRQGIKTAEMLMAHKVDVVFASEDLSSSGPGYAFANAGVSMRRTEAKTLKQVIEALPEAARSHSNSGG